MGGPILVMVTAIKLKIHKSGFFMNEQISAYLKVLCCVLDSLIAVKVLRLSDL